MRHWMGEQGSESRFSVYHMVLSCWLVGYDRFCHPYSFATSLRGSMHLYSWHHYLMPSVVFLDL